MAESLGYGKVELQEAIAEAHPGCRGVVYPRPSPAADDASGREYFTFDAAS